MHELFDWLMAAGGQLTTVTLNSSTTWVAPASVTRLESVTGRGQNGTPITTAIGYAEGASATYWPSGTGNEAGVYSWTSMNNFVNSAQQQINGGGSGTVAIPNLQQYADTSYSFFINNVAYSNAIPGTAVIEDVSGSWGTTGNVTASGERRIRYDYQVAATNGSATVGFGYTFPGGVGAPATAITHTGVTVTPGGSYPVTIAPGGSIVITYYA